MLSVSGPCFPLAHWAGWDVLAPHSGLPGGRRPPSLLVLVASVCSLEKHCEVCSEVGFRRPTLPSEKRAVPGAALRPQAHLLSGPVPADPDLRPFASVSGTCSLPRARVLVHGLLCVPPGTWPPRGWHSQETCWVGGCHSVACSDTLGGVGEATLLSVRTARPSARAPVCGCVPWCLCPALHMGAQAASASLCARPRQAGASCPSPLGRWFTRRAWHLGTVVCRRGFSDAPSVRGNELERVPVSQAGRAGFLEGGGGVSERRRRGSVAEGHHGAGAVVATVAASVTEVALGLDQGRALRLNPCPWRQDGAPGPKPHRARLCCHHPLVHVQPHSVWRACWRFHAPGPTAVSFREVGRV